MPLKNNLQSDIVARIGVVLSGAAAAQVITFACAPFVARACGPAAIGAIGLFNTLVALLAPIVSLAYPMAIVLPSEDRDAANLYKLCYLLPILLVAPVTIFTVLPFAASIDHEGFGAVWLALCLPPMLLLIAWYQADQYRCFRFRAFGIVSSNLVIHSILLNAAKLLVGVFGGGGQSLVLVTVVSQAFHTLLLRRGAPGGFSLLQPTSTFSFVSIKLLGRKYVDFPLYRAPQVSLNALAHGAPVILIANLFGVAEAGLFSFAQLIVVAPSTLIGRAAGDVIYPEIADRIARKEQISGFMISVAVLLMVAAFLIFLPIGFFGPEIFGTLLGGEWEESGQYAAAMVPLASLSMVHRPFAVGAQAMRYQKPMLVWEVISTLVRLSVLVVSLLFLTDPIHIVFTYSMATAGCYIYLMYWINAQARIYVP